ncbi:MAG: heparan-alpha-glucosaminide N-acetyltransferase domain-containing protein [Aggregatilineales bacterium]
MRQTIGQTIKYSEGTQSAYAEKTRISASARLLSIDIVRGWAMLTMLLTHAGNEISNVDYRSAFRWSELSSVEMNSAQNWIGFAIGISAPAFFILLGMGFSLFVVSRKKRKWSEWEITKFSIVRGLIFIAIEQLVLNWQFTTFQYHPNVGVLTSMGIILIILALLRRFNVWTVAVFGIMILLGVQAYYYFVGQPADYNVLRSLFVVQSSSPMETTEFTFPILGWLPLVLLGYVTGNLIAEKRITLRRLSKLVGIGLLILFFAIRVLNGFGNLYDEHFFAFTKIPPSLAYTLFYAGIVFIMMWLYTYSKGGALNTILALFGQTSLLFYVLHEEFILNLTGRIFNEFPYSPIMLTFISFSFAAVVLYFVCYRYRDLRRKYPDSALKYF